MTILLIFCAASLCYENLHRDFPVLIWFISE